MEIEAVKERQAVGIPEMENKDMQPGTTDTSITNKIKEMEERTSDTEDKVVEIDTVAKENVKSKKFQA